MKRTVLILIVGISVLFLTSLYSQELTSREYKIGPKDLLEISVFGLDDLNRRVRVSEDGKITLPLLGEIPVEGLTQAELEKRLSELLEKDYLQDPQVTVFIAEYQSKVVYIDGAVRTPGTYELLGRQYLKQVITRAGGLTAEAGREIHVGRHHADGSASTIKISIDDLYLKGEADLDIPVEPNDNIHVPIDRTVNVYVMGQVRNPGALEVKRSNIPTLLQAIAQAGGFSERASKGKVKIKRIDENGQEIMIEVNVKDIEKGKKEDIKLQENDVVIVPETFF